MYQTTAFAEHLFFHVPVLSWQRHSVTDRKVFSIVTLKAPWIGQGVTCYLCQGRLDLHRLHIALNHYSPKLNGVWPPSLTHNEYEYFTSWLNSLPFSFITASEKRSEVHNWICHCLRGAPFNWVSNGEKKHGWFRLPHDGRKGIYHCVQLMKGGHLKTATVHYKNTIGVIAAVWFCRKLLAFPPGST